jgi:hypothetical protein
MAKAIEDAGDQVPYVAHRRNRGDWLVTVRASDLKKLTEAIHAGPHEQG